LVFVRRTLAWLPESDEEILARHPDDDDPDDLMGLTRWASTQPLDDVPWTRKWVMVAGPYTGGSDDPREWTANWRRLNLAALALLRAGYMPVVGVSLAKPMMDAAVGTDAERWDLMTELSLELVERCDACLRLEGSSRGADAEVARFIKLGKPVFHTLEQLRKGLLL
jgi:hypothetical protein